MIKVIFVCLGNICRSPSAEGIFKKIVKNSGLKDDIYIDSAGTSAYHVGEKADKRMREFASKRGYSLTSISRKLKYRDFSDFDYIIAMDNSNYIDILSFDVSGIYKSKVKMMTDFSKEFFSEDIPDPYYGGDDGFNRVIDMLEECCTGFLEFLKQNKEV